MTTAGPVLDYEANKLACHISDDGYANFYALMEASKYANFSAPFCKKYKWMSKYPLDTYLICQYQRYAEGENSLGFQQEWLRMNK